MKKAGPVLDPSNDKLYKMVEPSTIGDLCMLEYFHLQASGSIMHLVTNLKGKYKYMNILTLMLNKILHDVMELDDRYSLRKKNLTVEQCFSILHQRVVFAKIGGKVITNILNNERDIMTQNLLEGVKGGQLAYCQVKTFF